MKIRLAVSALLATGLANAQHPEPAAKPTPQNARPSQPSVPTAGVVQLGDEVPADTTLHDLNGDLHRLGDLRGRPVVLHMWSSTCPWQLTIDPKLNTLASDYEDHGVAVLGIAANGHELGVEPTPSAFQAPTSEARPYRNLRQRVAEGDIRHPILADHGARLGKLLEARTTGQIFVIDGQGRLAYTGALDDDGRGIDASRSGNHVRAALDAVLADAPVGTPQSPPYGGPTRFA